MRRSLMAALLVVAAPMSSASGPLTLRVQIPRVAIDDAPLLATVELRNISRAPMLVAAPGLDTLTAQSRLEVPLPDTKCSAQSFPARLGVAPRVITLEPGATAKSTIDLAANLPYGLPLGRQTVVVQYSATAAGANRWNGVVTSAPVEVELRAPSGAAAAVYAEFASLCHRVQAADASAPADVLDFAKKNPGFVYTRALVLQAAQIAGGPVAKSLNEYLAAAYPGTWQADVARRNIVAAERADIERDEYEKYVTSYQVALNDPANREAAQAKRALGTILDPGSWAANEEFLRVFGASPFAPEVLHSMIAAVERGVIPPGRDREELRAELYRKLVTTYESSYRAKEALRNPQVAAMVKERR